MSARCFLVLDRVDAALDGRDFARAFDDRRVLLIHNELLDPAEIGQLDFLAPSLL